MIYLIGGPPKVGKTTLAKELALQLQIPSFSLDYLMSIINPYLPIEKIPELLPRWQAHFEDEVKTSQELIPLYVKETETYWPGIEGILRRLIKDNQDYILEGTQLQPTLLRTFIDAQNKDLFKVLFLYEKGEPFGEYFKAECIAHNFMSHEQDNNIPALIKLLKTPHD